MGCYDVRMSEYDQQSTMSKTKGSQVPARRFHFYTVLIQSHILCLNWQSNHRKRTTSLHLFTDLSSIPHTFPIMPYLLPSSQVLCSQPPCPPPSSAHRTGSLSSRCQNMSRWLAWRSWFGVEADDGGRVGNEEGQSLACWEGWRGETHQQLEKLI